MQSLVNPKPSLNFNFFEDETNIETSTICINYVNSFDIKWYELQVGLRITW
jgi:hypothetical protein